MRHEGTKILIVKQLIKCYQYKIVLSTLFYVYRLGRITGSGAMKSSFAERPENSVQKLSEKGKMLLKQKQQAATSWMPRLARLMYVVPLRLVLRFTKFH